MTVPPRRYHYRIICSAHSSVVIIVWLSLLPCINSYYSHVHHFYTNSHTSHTRHNHNLHKTIEYCLHSYISNVVLHITLFIILYLNGIEFNLPLITPYFFSSLIIYLTTYIYMYISLSSLVRGYFDLKIFIHRNGNYLFSKIFNHYSIIKATSYTNIYLLLVPCCLGSVNNYHLNTLCWVSVQIALLCIIIICHNG